MAMLTSFYGQVLLCAVIVCGITWMVSVRQGNEVLKRAGLSVLLFSVGTIVLPSSEMSPMLAAVRILVSLFVVCAAFLALINPDSAQEILRRLIAVIVGAALLAIGMRYLWSSAGGRMVTAGVLVIAGLYLKHRSARE